MYAISCLFALVALGLAYANSAQSAMLLGGTGVVVLVLMRKLGYMNLRDAAQEIPRVRQRNLQLRTTLRQSTTRLRAANDLTEMWESLRPLAEAMGTAKFALELSLVTHGSREGVRFESVREGGTALPLEVFVDVTSADKRFGRIVVSWRDGREQVNRDEEIALEQVAEAVAAAIVRQSQTKTTSPVSSVRPSRSISPPS
jgi:UDP-GlcNAc:undecaprenyl-phosphate GlcNAc-1-phosphate transferase